MTTTDSESSGLAFIELSSGNPFDLFRQWYTEAWAFSTGTPSALCLATVSKDMKVSARHLILRQYNENGFVIYTDNRSRKSKELAEVPAGAMCFLWSYTNDKSQKVTRQVRIEGDIVVVDKDCYEEMYNNDQLFCKIRSHICHQDQEVDWNDLKARHDQLLNEVLLEKKSLPMPDHIIAYRMVPTSIEFYYARDNLIADRLLFERDGPSGAWKHKRLAA